MLTELEQKALEAQKEVGAQATALGQSVNKFVDACYERMGAHTTAWDKSGTRLLASMALEFRSNISWIMRILWEDGEEKP